MIKKRGKEGGGESGRTEEEKKKEKEEKEREQIRRKRENERKGKQKRNLHIIIYQFIPLKYLKKKTQ